MLSVFLVFSLVMSLASCGDSASSAVAAQNIAANSAAAQTMLTPFSKPEPFSAASVPEGEIIDIKEKMFIAQTNDVYFNYADYVGKTIRYQGIYKNAVYDEAVGSIHFVIRYGPGCCGYDGEAGFEILWEGEYPEVDDWVEVIGVIKRGNIHSEYPTLYVEPISITVKNNERGEEFVTM